MVNATVFQSDGGTVNLTADFVIGTPPSPYALYCSADASLDESDPLCESGIFDPGVYVFVLPEEDINSVQVNTTSKLVAS